MAMQTKVMACGVALTIFGIITRFIAAPMAMGIVAFAIGLRGDILCVAILQVFMVFILA